MAKPTKHIELFGYKSINFVTVHMYNKLLSEDSYLL